VLRLPCELERLQCDPPESACRVAIKGDFLFHCHLEEHMMAGLAGLVRSRESIWVTPEVLKAIDLVPPYDDGRNEAGWVDLERCRHRCPTGKLTAISRTLPSHINLRSMISAISRLPDSGLSPEKRSSTGGGLIEVPGGISGPLAASAPRTN
jgi:Multicopper oxidase